LTESTTSSSAQLRRKLDRFLGAYWLRPENAFWMVLRSWALDTVPIARPVLDVACGDGVFSFLHAGGRFAPEFDVFQCVDHLDRVTQDHADMFDAADDAYRPAVLVRPDDRIDCGLELKPALAFKASRLNLYNKVIQHDANKPLPLADDAFETIYCNAAYWLERVDDFLAELSRVCRPRGTIVLQVKTDAIRECTFERHAALLGDRWLDLIGRGRFDTWPSLCDADTWQHRFERAGLETLAEVPIATQTHAHIWDVGLRPIAPLLTKAMNALHPHLRNEIKSDWIDLFATLLEPFCNADFDLLDAPGEPVEIQYVLTPRS